MNLSTLFSSHSQNSHPTQPSPSLEEGWKGLCDATVNLVTSGIRAIPALTLHEVRGLVKKALIQIFILWLCLLGLVFLIFSLTLQMAQSFDFSLPASMLITGITLISIGAMSATLYRKYSK